MGYLPEPAPEMGEYHIEIRRESFYLAGEHNWDNNGYIEKRHAIHVYENGDCGQGTAEILLEDIPKIIAALEQAQRVAAGNPLKE